MTSSILTRLSTNVRAVARSEIPGRLVVLGGDNVSPLVEIGLDDLPNIGGTKTPQPPPCDGPSVNTIAISNHAQK